jgi:hypothetical protein
MFLCQVSTAAKWSIHVWNKSSRLHNFELCHRVVVGGGQGQEGGNKGGEEEKEAERFKQDREKDRQTNRQTDGVLTMSVILFPRPTTTSVLSM